MKNPEKLRINLTIQVAEKNVSQTITDQKELSKTFISEANSDLEAGKQIS